MTASAATRLLVSKSGFLLAAHRGAPVRVARAGRRMVSHGSDSITYSGGQATEGQGGFYGSGGARSALSPETEDSSRQQLLALAADVERITRVMEEIDALEESLRESHASGGVTSQSMEIKNAIKKRLTAPDVIESLNRLEVQGQPTWGLSTKERELIMAAREKMNES